MPFFRITVPIILSLLLSACAILQESDCSSGSQFAIEDSLYFGSVKPNGIVTTEEWGKFLETTVTPRFPQGLTIFESVGQWRNAHGLVIRELTHTLKLVHPEDKPSEKLVAEIISSYKALFQQESVLRVKMGACVSF
ncbi:MAG: DUF3574 domain-containing protein [Methylococcales bacterium]|nr:DUF3574 domain-containing protein [Methylococcales bacterium]